MYKPVHLLEEMWGQRLKSFASFDAIAMLGVTSGTGLVLYQAHLEGTGPLQRQVGAHKSKYETKLHSLGALTTDQCDLLSKRGYLIVDNFLSREEVKAAIRSARIIEERSNEAAQRINQKSDSDLQEGGELAMFAASANQQEEVSKGRDRVRTDSVCFISGSNDNKECGLGRVRKKLRGIASLVEESGFQGFAAALTTSHEGATAMQSIQDVTLTTPATSTGSWIGVPDGMQLSLYEESTNVDGTKSGKGAYYLAHLDGCSDSFLDLGLLGYLRSSYLRKRYITAIVYINDDDEQQQRHDSSTAALGKWDTDRDGGCLRLYPDGNDQGVGESEIDWVDVAPTGGRLVLFSSQRMLHAVLPTMRKRMACSLWLTLND
jgi:hypothetical protein